jgi:eukaryotic-like serine/threonine-protein kinase
METNGLSRIERLFHAALKLDAAERFAYLARECAGEEKLYAEVESLVEVFERRADFLEKPAFNAGLKALVAEASESLEGKIIGSYKVVRLLGKGGMGEVYLAEDTRLGRQVALKFLANRLAADNWAKRQLIKEAQAVAILDHPNICTVHGLEQVDGHSFIVMQYLEGETLADLIYEGRLDAQQTLPLALQMVGALTEAHAHGIIHCDIKPRNLVLTADGKLKVLDFGLAKIIQGGQNVAGVRNAPSQTSQAGLILGTVAYMSPEQLRGKRLDFRSDVFSVGVVLYELASAKHPFAQENDAETIAAILTSQPPYGVNGFPHRLERVIKKCLEKDRERRYQSASELLLDLQNLQTGTAARWKVSRFNPVAAVALLVLLIAGALLTYSRLTAHHTLAVLPFINESPGHPLDYLVAGFPNSLANQLARLSHVKVKSPTIVSSYKGQEADLKRIGEELDVDTLLVGKAMAQGNGRVLEIRLVDTSDASQLWVARYDLNKTDALVLQELIAAEVAGNLRLRLSGEDQKLLRSRPTTKTEAFHEYLRGRYIWSQRNKDNIDDAIASFRRAIALDPAYAQAYTGLADSYVLLNTVAYGHLQTQEAMNNAKWGAKQALTIDYTLPEAHTSLGIIKLKHDWDWQGAEAAFKQAIQLNQEYAIAHYWYSNLLIITGRWGEGVAESEIARELDPFSATMSMNRCRAWFQTRQYDLAARCFTDMLEKQPGDKNAQYILGLVYQEKGMYDDAVEIFKKLYETDKSFAAAPLGYIYGRKGKRTEAFKILAEMEEVSKQKYLPPLEFAIVYVGLDDRDKAFEWLEKAYDERFSSLIYLTVEPLFTSLHSDPRFADLARRVGLTPPTT